MDNSNNKLRIPKGKVKNIIKLNESIKLMNKDAYIFMAKATELLLQDLALQAEKVTKFNKRRTMNQEDICKIII